MTYDYKSKKVVAVLSANLEPEVALNVVGHLAISIGAYGEDLMGREKLFDASGVAHTGIAKYPFIVTKLRPGKLNALIERAKAEAGLLVADYPEEVLYTKHDDELAEAVAAKVHSQLKYMGAILFGDAEIVDALTGKFSLWRYEKPTEIETVLLRSKTGISN
jgi:hypothetical protein